MVEKKPIHQDRKIKSRVVVVNICYSRHGDKRNIMEDPADEGVYSCSANMVNFLAAEIVISTLPSDEV